ncbi:MAG: chemotaxis protein CheW [Acidobacteria bacterium]|nr:chemotaxis protein CheW [Acidobacteriota bacterium]
MARTVLVFESGPALCGLPVEQVREVVHMASLARPPGTPSLLEGFLNLRGVAVPVVRLDRLFDWAPASPSLYAPLLILRGDPYPLALLATRTLEVVSPPPEAFLPVREETLQGCVEAEVALGERVVHLLSAPRLLLEKERKCVEQLQAAAQQRLDELEAERP